MAITTNQATVSTSAVLLYTAANNANVTVSNSNATATNTLSIGPTSGVTAGSGLLVLGGQTVNIRVPAGGTIYGIRGGAADVVASLWAQG